MEIFFQLGLVLFLVLLNGYFVASEFALVAIRKTRVEELAKKGNVTAKMLKGALDNLDTYISSTQLGITLASLALGWIGEPALAHFLEPLFSFLPKDAAWFSSHAAAVIVAFSTITFLHIVLGELAPKSIALQRPEATSLWVITPLVLFTKIFKPFIWILNGAGQMVLRIFGFRALSGHHLLHSEEEIKMLLRQSGQGGAIPEKEVEMVHNVFQLGDIPVKLIMVPRTEILSLKNTAMLKEVLKQVHDHPHSRFPVYEGTIDNIVGFVHIKDIYKKLVIEKDSSKLSQMGIIREIITVPENKKIDSVLQDMRRKRVHLAIVNDEFGGTAGIVTLEDIIESLVGEIDDEFDIPIKNIIKQKDGTYLVDGHTLIEEVQERFRLPLKGQGYTTIGGLVFGLLGHEPSIGEVVQVDELLFEVAEIDGKRIKILRLKRDKKK